MMGIKEGALHERALIVKFLRECQSILEANILVGGDRSVIKHYTDACRLSAQAIEDGAHELSA
jgi:hypothetical protein